MHNSPKLKLQPHQIRLSQKLSTAQFPLYLYWGMGSGKSIGGILTIAAFLEENEVNNGLVICDKSVKAQWASEVKKFFNDESCGQCTPCRVGTEKAVKLMEKNNWDEDLLRELVQTMGDASICGLGQAAGNPITCTLNFFKSHI